MSSYFDHFLIIEFGNPLITNSFIVIFFTLFVYLLFKNIISSRYQLVIELIFEHWYLVLKENLGDVRYFYLFSLLFLFILSINLYGFFIYTFTPTTHISITFGLALIVWLTVIFIGFGKHQLDFFSNFMPSGSPLGMSPLLVIIELASNFSRPVALGMRLAANLTAGHILLAILADFSMKLLVVTNTFSIFPILIIIFMTVLEVGVLVIQAYVFCLLSMIYLKDSIILH